MATDYTDFIKQACDIFSLPHPTEISYRCAISRSYYGAYHSALNFADSISTPLVSATGGPTHRKLSLYFEDSFHSDKSLRLRFRKLGYCLKQLHDLRCKADYNLNDAITSADAASHIERCKLRIQEVDNLNRDIAA